MFAIEKTELHHSFGATVHDVIHHLYELNEQQDDDERVSYLFDLTGCNEPEELLTKNPHAIKYLEQNPECIRLTALHMNPSEEILYYWKYNQLPHYERELGFTKAKNLDTYLQVACVGCLNFRSLSSNPQAFPFLRKHLDKVDWVTLSENPEAVDLLEYYQDNISFIYLSTNPHPRAIALLRNNIDQICWERLSKNPCDEAIDLLEEYPQHIFHSALSSNTHDRAIDLLIRQGIDRVNWWNLSRNPCRKAVELLRSHPEKIKWGDLCAFANTQRQFDLIRDYPDKIDWSMLCLNRHELVLPLLLENQDRIVWCYSLGNQPIFETVTTYDYAGIRGARRELHEEYHAWAGHPVRLQAKWKGWGLLEEGCF